MLYSEFIQGTGCKDNQHNYEIYRRLEIIYMNDETATKQDIYDYGKRLADNSPSESEIAFHNQIVSDIEAHKERIKTLKEQGQRYKELHDYDRTDTFWKSNYDYVNSEIKREKSEINKLKWILSF